MLFLQAFLLGDGVFSRSSRCALLAGDRGGGRRVERTFAPATGERQGGDNGADQGQIAKRAIENAAQDLRSLRHHSKPANQGEVRISPFRASAATSWPASARFLAPCRQNSSGSSPNGRPRGR